MKHIKFLSLSFFFCFVLFACNSKKGADLVRTWQVTGVETSADLPDSLRNAMIANSKMVFTSEGAYTTTGGIGVDQGTYTLDKDTRLLSTVSTAGKSSEVYTIDKLDKENLILTNKGNTVTCIAVK